MSETRSFLAAIICSIFKYIKINNCDEADIIGKKINKINIAKTLIAFKACMGCILQIHLEQSVLIIGKKIFMIFNFNLIR